jgi:hypothetical protein
VAADEADVCLTHRDSFSHGDEYLFFLINKKEQEMTDTEGRKVDAEIAKLIAETSKLVSETSKVIAETAKLNKETFWHPMALATGLVLAVGAVVKFIL